MSGHPTVHTEVNDSVAHIVLDDPENGNDAGLSPEKRPKPRAD